MKPDPRRVWCVTLGCDKNLVDSEALLGRFLARGFVQAADPQQAGIWVLNTCGFIDAARQDSLATLQDWIRDKGTSRILVVTGCWAQEQREAIARRFPEVDLIGGVGEFEQLVAACTAGEKTVPAIEPARARYEGLLDRPLLTPAHLAYLKISEGCDCHCTFCRIPLIRGPLRSRPIAEITTEATRLAHRGVQEVVIVSQNTADFGRDTSEDLLSLVRELDRIGPLRWIRVLYLYPERLNRATLQKLLACEKVVPYLDLPIQHASPPILKAMKRPADPRKVANLLERLRQENPELVLRTTCLLGFPGEVEEDVEVLADFLARVKFDHLGTYRYSPEENTPATSLGPRVPAEVAVDREALILDVQAEVTLARQLERLGGRYPVLVDAVWPARKIADLLEGLRAGTWQDIREQGSLTMVLETNGLVALGRSHHFAFDLDGVVAWPEPALRPGDWTELRFAAVTPFDVWALPYAS